MAIVGQKSMDKIRYKKFSKTISAIIVLLVLTSPSIVLSQNREQIGAIGKIQADYKTQKITFDEYILYKAWAVFKPEKLSRVGYELSAKDAKFRKDGTPTILEIKKNWDKLSPETQNILRCEILLRPDDGLGCEDGIVDALAESIVSANFIVHYTTAAGDHAVTAEYAQDISDYFEYSYNAEVTTLTYLAPPSDGIKGGGDGLYDIYIYDLGEGLYGYTCPEEYPATPSYSYICMNSDYSSWVLPNEDPESDAAGAAKVTAAHEFFHAIQFNYDVTEELWWMETTATYMEDEVYPDVNDNYNYLWYWFEYCDTLGLQTEDGAHEYANFIFAKYLSEAFTDEIIKDIWEECQTPLGTDGLIAINNVLSSEAYSSNLEDEFDNFTEANFFLEDMYVDGADYRAAVDGTWNPILDTTYDGVWVTYEYTVVEDISEVTIDKIFMDDWATDYITLDLDSSSESYDIDFAGGENDANYLVKLVTKKGVDFDERTISLNAQKEGHISLSYDTYDDVVLVIANAGDADIASWEVNIAREISSDGNDDGFDGDDGFDAGDGFGGGGDGGGGCFIATACYGTSMAEEVITLRNFRDECLLNNLIGNIFVNTYYKISPPMADFIREHPMLKNTIRVMLKPVVWLADILEN
ncbi:MAG: DUF6055 domain-containing protein [Candidatus Ratteibacteria bacterium]|nr:DUF6055 domain-containing protein [Candidatus Ratteibacteria bacterium]